jgi:hypothetical protein
MKRRLVLLMISMLVFCGCVTHYYRKNNDTLSIFLKKPGAKQVYFLSSLDGYKPRKATRIDSRTWQINTPAKSEFRYFYDVDGAVYLPECPLREKDDFGSQICIYMPGL